MRGDSTEYKGLKQKFDSLDFEVRLLRLKVERLEVAGAEITTEPKYALARNQFGVFPVSYGRAVPYLDGHKIYLDIGNPTTMRFAGAKVKVNYGRPEPRLANGDVDFSKWDEYRAGRKDYEIDVTNEFAPGRYTAVELTISPSKPEEVRELEVHVEFNVIKLPGGTQ